MPPSNGPDSSQVVAKKGKKSKNPPQRRGPKGYFQGSRKEFLEGYLPAYTASKKGSRQNFWHTLYAAWWRRYPWRLDDDQEPPTDDPEKMARLASVAPGDEALKSLVEKTLTERLSTWFKNHASSANNESRQDTLGWLPLLQQLHKLRNPRPRKRTAPQQFMADYPLLVNAAFVSKHGEGKGLSKSERLNHWNETAKHLLYSEHSQLVKGLEDKAQADYDKGDNEWKMILDNISLAADVSQARDTLFDAVHPLLQAIGSYAGCYVTLIAGNAEKDDTDEGFFTAVHWWPGDRPSVKDWTQWDSDKFNSGVAGPFLAYAGETNQLLRAQKNEPLPAVETPKVSPPLVLPDAVHIVNDPPAADGPSLAHIQPTASTTVRRESYRPLPAQSTTSAGGIKKRKYASKESRPVRYSEDSESEDGTANSDSGDGSSSGGSISDAPKRQKRQRTSRIVTRSSTRVPAPGARARGPSDLASPAIPNVETGTPDPALSTTTASVTVSTNSPDIQSASASADAMDTDVPSGGDATRTSYRALTGTGDTSLAETEATHGADSEDPPAVNAEDPTAVNAEDPTATNAKDPPTTDTEVSTATEPITAASTADPNLHAPSQNSLRNITEAGVPSFLLRHGTGKRVINIFGYLNNVKDPHFREVLAHYIRFETNSSGVARPLPTPKRPVEIKEWTSRARPAGLPDYTKGRRTFADFVDSVFVWWASVQPSWRTFERGEVSREVCGEWGVLCAPGINGLLNVVVLVYWWIGVLEEHNPEGSLRADYEFFANDVAWVFSSLST